MIIGWAFNQEVVYKKFTGDDGWGVPTYEPPITLEVWWSAKMRLVRAANGEEKMSEADVKTPLTIDPKANDVFEYKGKDYRVLNSGTPPNIYGETGHRSLFVETAVV